MFNYNVFLCEFLRCHWEINFKRWFGCWASNGLPQTARDCERMLRLITPSRIMNIRYFALSFSGMSGNAVQYKMNVSREYNGSPSGRYYVAWDKMLVNFSRDTQKRTRLEDEWAEGLYLRDPRQKTSTLSVQESEKSFTGYEKLSWLTYKTSGLLGVYAPYSYSEWELNQLFQSGWRIENEYDILKDVSNLACQVQFAEPGSLTFWHRSFTFNPYPANVENKVSS